jgi:NAD(P)H-nitrite reductase large subunit/Ni,Fe-hydrogenase III small subunit
MQEFKYVIIGGGIAGTTAAETIRKNDPQGSIAIISDEPYRLYSRIMMSKPNFFLGKVPFEQIWLKKESWYGESKIEFISGKKATKIDTQNKMLSLQDGTEIKYEKMLLATGACARGWNVPCGNKRGIFYLRTLNDGKAIMEAIKTTKHAVAIGGGFINFEMADLLKMAGKDITIIIREKHYWDPVLDETAGRMVEKALKGGGVKILYESEVKEVLGEGKVENVILKDDTRIECDMIICGIGVVCPMDWLKDTGIKTNRGIVTDEYMKTDAQDVWAAGDVAEYNDLLLEETVQLGNWVNAQEQGRIAGLNMAGKKEPFKFVSFYTTQGFETTIAAVGDVRPAEDRDMITRGSMDINSYARILVVNGELVGATMVNRTKELKVISDLIRNNIKVSEKHKELSDPDFDLKQLLIKKEPATAEKIKIGWFPFSCCEDNTIVFTEIMNDHWQEWKKIFDFRHVRVLKSKNIFDEFDVAFIEGAIASPEHEKMVKDIRERSKKVVAVGACAVTGLPAGQRNIFTDEQKANIKPLVEKFGALPKVLKVSEVVKVDAEVPGCPMNPDDFVTKVNALVKELKG